MTPALSTIWQIFGAYRVHLVILVVLGLAGAFLEGIGINAAIPLLSFLTGGGGVPTDPISRIIASVFAFLHIPFSFRYLLFLIIGLFLARAVAVALFSFIRGWIVADFLNNESRAMFRSLLEASWPFLLKQKIGHVHNTLVRDIQRTSSLFEMASQIIQSSTGFLMYFAVAFVISPTMTLLALVGAAGLLGLTRPLLKRTVASGAEMATGEKEVAQFLNEHVAGMKLIKASGMSGAALRAAHTLLGGLRTAYIRIMVVRSISTSLFQPFAIIFVVFLFAFMYQTPGFSIIAFAATLYLIQKIFTYAESAQSSVHGLGEVLPYVRSVTRFKKDLDAAREDQTPGGEEFSFERELEFRNVSLAYGEKRVLSDVSLTVGRGEIVGLIGPSGAGKTSLADLVLRLFRPSTGVLLLDGVPVEDIAISQWRHNIGYVPQDVFLLNDTIEENIRFYNDALTREDIVRAAKQANIHDFIMELEHGFDTITGDRGVMLSGGQRQRIALARALAHRPSLLILDEATSSLDSESERLVQAAIGSLHGSITVIIIAHRLSTIEDADRIVVLDKGNITEEGAPAELLKDPNSYFSTHR